jgi:hypothetical protein
MQFRCLEHGRARLVAVKVDVKARKEQVLEVKMSFCLGEWR